MAMHRCQTPTTAAQSPLPGEPGSNSPKEGAAGRRPDSRPLRRCSQGGAPWRWSCELIPCASRSGGFPFFLKAALLLATPPPAKKDDGGEFGFNKAKCLPLGELNGQSWEKELRSAPASRTSTASPARSLADERGGEHTKHSNTPYTQGQTHQFGS
jgi:hypothetical protein